MKELNYEELRDTRGGFISGTLLSSLVKGVNAIYDLGRFLGSSIRRITSRKICPL